MKKTIITLLVFVFTINSSFAYTPSNKEINLLNQAKPKIIEIYKTDVKKAYSIKNNIGNLIIEYMSKSKKSESIVYLLNFISDITNEFIASYEKELSDKQKEESKEPETSTNEPTDNKGNTEENINNPTLFPDTEITERLFLSGSKDNKIMAFRIRAEYDNIKLKDLVLYGQGLDNLSNFRLLTPNGKQISASVSTSNKLEFSSINSIDNYIIERDNFVYYNILADTNTNTNKKEFNLTLDTSNSTFLSLSNGRSYSLSGNNASTYTYLIMNNKTVITKLQTTDKSIFTPLLEFNVSASGKNDTVLTKAIFNNIFSGYDKTNAKISVYKDGNLVGSSSNSVVSGEVILDRYNTVSSGNSSKYVVKIEGLDLDSNARNQYWTISLTGLETGDGINLAEYRNLGDFPITEVKQ